MGFEARWSDLLGGLTVRLTVGPSGHANSPHPSSREGHHSTARWSSSFLLSRLILLGGLTVRLTVGPSGHANSPHPSSREGHHSTARWSSSFLLSRLILPGFHAAAGVCFRVQRNSVPSTQMRCMITARRRARATIAFFIPRRLAICIAQALSHDHFFDRNML
jgi:hypothetical protein